MNKISAFFLLGLLIGIVDCTLFAFVTIDTSVSRIVVAQNVVDSFSNFVIEASIANSGTNPNTWVFQNISASLSTGNSAGPRLFSNNNGDFVLLWNYIDDITGNQELAAAVLLNSSTTWQVANISQGIGIVHDSNYKAVFDDANNILIVWSSFINVDYASLIATSSLSSISWSVPYTFPS
jgi:hypothetical protein